MERPSHHPWFVFFLPNRTASAAYFCLLLFTPAYVCLLRLPARPVSADLRSIPAASAAILQNPEVIAVNQDPLVRQARRIKTTAAGVQVWRKDLVDGSVAVALFNGQDGPVGNVSLQFEDVGFTAVDRVTVRDLVRRRDVGGGGVSHVGGLSLADPIPGHGVVLLNVTVVWDL